MKADLVQRIRRVCVLSDTYTDQPHSPDPQVRAMFCLVNDDPGRFTPENEVERMVKWFRAWDKVRDMKGEW